jgi:hypothetical protein
MWKAQRAANPDGIADILRQSNTNGLNGPDRAQLVGQGADHLRKVSTFRIPEKCFLQRLVGKNRRIVNQ